MIPNAELSAVADYFLAPELDELSTRGLESAFGRPVSSDELREVAHLILDIESASMRRIKEVIASERSDPLDKIVTAFRMVGDNLARDPKIRAGVVIASRWSGAFPERRIDPFRTWESFVAEALQESRRMGRIRQDIDVVEASWVVVAAGIGAKELIAFRDAWADAGYILEWTARSTLAPLRMNLAGS
jgi:hypothetical protein